VFIEFADKMNPLAWICWDVVHSVISYLASVPALAGVFSAEVRRHGSGRSSGGIAATSFATKATLTRAVINVAGTVQQHMSLVEDTLVPAGLWLAVITLRFIALLRWCVGPHVCPFCRAGGLMPVACPRDLYSAENRSRKTPAFDLKSRFKKSDEHV
jgi:hypothetical protein